MTINKVCGSGLKSVALRGPGDPDRATTFARFTASRTAMAPQLRRREILQGS